jgi:short-subunit dehydrogenase
VGTRFETVGASGPLVAVITGASSGIGEATARRLAHELPLTGAAGVNGSAGHTAAGNGAHLVLVARREERLRQLAQTLPVPCSCLALDLTDEDAPARVLAHLHEHCGGRLTLLVNNAGAAWRAPFAEGGYANVRRTMETNFDAPVRLAEALLPLLRECAPSAIVNVSSTAARVTRPGTGAYSASKFALTGWSDALYAEEHAHGVHVGTVFPGFVATEGFPARELLARRQTAWIVSTPDRVAEAILEVGLGRRAERYVPRAYFLAAAARLLAPGLVRRALTRGSASIFTTKTGAEHARAS